MKKIMKNQDQSISWIIICDLSWSAIYVMAMLNCPIFLNMQKLKIEY